jgi:hypothetical protein
MQRFRALFVLWRRPVLLLFCLLAQVGSISFMRASFGPHGSALLFFLASITTGYLGLQMARERPEPPGESGTRKMGPLALYLVLAILIFIQVQQLIQQHPVKVEDSDVIPQTQALVQRQLAGVYPYQPIPMPGYELYPTYQPLQWLPYSLAQWLGFDYRLQALGSLLLVGLLFVFVQRKERRLSGWALPVLFLFPLLILAFTEHTLLYRTLECGIAAYYFLLCWALWQRSIALLGLAFVFCLFSRYSVIFYVPLFLACLWISGQRKYFRQVIEILVLGFLLVYFLPYFSKDPSIFWRGYSYHTQAALAEWKGQPWQLPGEKPVQLFRGMGMAGLFYDFIPGPVEQRLDVLRKIHLAFSLLTVIGLGWYYYRNRLRVSLSLFLLAALQIYLSVFYHFIQIPYDYLFLTLIYVSIPIAWLSLRYRGQSSFQV